MNTRAKGNRNQQKAIKWLKADGWEVAIVERTSRFIKEKDAFGVADLCCLKQGHVLFVQVTSNKPHGHAKYRAFIRRFGSEFVSMWQVVVIDRVKEFKVIKY
jgi:hypothetical protein